MIKLRAEDMTRLARINCDAFWTKGDFFNSSAQYRREWMKATRAVAKELARIEAERKAEGRGE